MKTSDNNNIENHRITSKTSRGSLPGHANNHLEIDDHDDML